MQEPSKFCPACGAQNRISAQFCQACGSRAPVILATPVIQKQPKKQNGIALLIVCGVAVFGCAGLTAIISAVRSNKSVGSTSFATPTPTSIPTPALSPAKHLAEVKKLLSGSYGRGSYELATQHLNAISPEAKEYEEAQRIVSEASKRLGREERAAEATEQISPYTPDSLAGERMVLNNTQVTVYVECTNREWKQYKFRFIVKKSGSPLLTPILRQVGNPNAYSVVVNGVDTGDGDLAFSPNIAAFDRNGKLITADFNTRPLNGNEELGRAYYNLIAKYERGN
jgi:hypothetical protein